MSIHLARIRERSPSILLVGQGTELARRASGIDGVRVVPRRRLGLAFALRKALALANVFTVVSHFTRDLPAIRLALAGRPETRLLIVKHVSPGPPKHDIIHRIVYRRVDRMLAVSDYVRRKCARVYPLPPERVSVWYPGIDVTRFVFNRRARVEIRGEEGIDNDVPVLGAVSRITPHKGLEDLLEVTRRLLGEHPRLVLMLVGGAAAEEKWYERNLRQKVQSLGLDRSIRLCGRRENVAEYYSAFDIFVTPSRHEAFGLTTVEAMAAQRPVAGFRAAGTAEIVRDGETGLLADPDSDRVAGMARVLDRLLRDPGRASTLGCAGRQRACERFSIDAMMRSLDTWLHPQT